MTEFKGKTKDELKTLLATKQEALRKFRFEVAGSKIRNVKEGRNLKKQIAQIFTEINAK